MSPIAIAYSERGNYLEAYRSDVDGNSEILIVDNVKDAVNLIDKLEKAFSLYPRPNKLGTYNAITSQ